jgi:hypothetical protein
MRRTPVVKCREQGESLIELFKSIHVFGKWPNNLLLRN